MSDRSFVRFAGLAGILLALTSWVAVAVYYTLVPAEQRLPLTVGRGALSKSLSESPFGLELFNGLIALTAVWSLFGVAAMYRRTRGVGEAWSFFATVLGMIAAAGWLAASVYDIASIQLVKQYSGSAVALDDQIRYVIDGPSPVNPLNVLTLGLTSIWFLVVALLMPRSGFPRLLQILGFVAFADLAAGFIASLFGITTLSIATRVIAGGVGGPLFWLWLGILLWRDPREGPSPQATAAAPTAARYG